MEVKLHVLLMSALHATTTGYFYLYSMDLFCSWRQKSVYSRRNRHRAEGAL